MGIQETIKFDPAIVPRTIRYDEIVGGTSAEAGKIVPLAYAPLFREDRISASRVRVNIEMMETAELLMNAVNVTVYAHFVPFLASDRFMDIGAMNRSYMKKPEVDGNVITFNPTMTFDQQADLWRTMGVHMPQNATVNAWPVEAYNLIVNHRRKTRSKNLPLRTALDTTLAEAFWNHNAFSHIVPDYDSAKLDGEVPLNILPQGLPIRGLGIRNANYGTPLNSNLSVQETWKDTNSTYEYSEGTEQTNTVVVETDAAGKPLIFAEMEAQGVMISLANMELAKQTAAFAAMREKYKGIDEEHIIDLLMAGVRVPEESMANPILLDRKKTIMGYNRRYATDAANLDVSRSNGQTFVDLQLRTPPMNTGGVLMITMEVVPEQLFERQNDYFVSETDQDTWPEAVRDFLDPEKVSIVPNKHVDVLHSNPDATFGYAPLNHQWKRQLRRMGGKYLRPVVDAPFDEDRQKIWAAETLDPELTADFYLCTDLHKKVFADTASEPLEIGVNGTVNIVGLTQFGKGLQEDTDDYEAISAQVDTGRIDQG
jgi:hypothetical protein